MSRVATSEAARLRLRVAGLVQGVGFRPYVHRLATELGLTGHVGNDARGVFVEVEGRKETTEEFVRRLVDGGARSGPYRRGAHQSDGTKRIDRLRHRREPTPRHGPDVRVTRHRDM